jgi:hypothetical protein
MNDDLDTQKMRKCIGKKVNFHYPTIIEEDKKGVLKDRSIIRSNPNNKIPYWDVVDLIEFPNEEEKDWIRIGYYRKPKDRLVWASQTTITEPISIWRRILTQAAKEKPWFKKLLLEVVEGLKD